MDRKRFLARTIGLLGLVAIAAMTFIFITSLRPSAKAVNEASVLLEIGDLTPGKVTMKEVKGRRLFFLKPNAAQKQAIAKLNEHVWNSSLSNYEPAVNAYVYWGMNTKWGCDLDHIPPQEPRIKEWEESASWLGGYWDHQCEVSYDYAGRSIRSYKYTFNGYTAKFPNLKKPPLRRSSNGKVTVSMLNR